MHTNVFAGLKQVQIIEVPDKRGPDNRSCTVLVTPTQVMVTLVA